MHIALTNAFHSLFSNKILVILSGIHKMLVRMASIEDTDQTVCLGLYSRQLVLKILEHLPILLSDVSIDIWNYSRGIEP